MYVCMASMHVCMYVCMYLCLYSVRVCTIYRHAHTHTRTYVHTDMHNAKMLETGLRTNGAGIRYTLLLRIEPSGFPTFVLLL